MSYWSSSSSLKIEQDACSAKLEHGWEEEAIRLPVVVASSPISRESRERSKYRHYESTSHSLWGPFAYSSPLRDKGGGLNAHIQDLQPSRIPTCCASRNEWNNRCSNSFLLMKSLPLMIEYEWQSFANIHHLPHDKSTIKSGSWCFSPPKLRCLQNPLIQQQNK